MASAGGARPAGRWAASGSDRRRGGASPAHNPGAGPGAGPAGGASGSDRCFDWTVGRCQRGGTCRYPHLGPEGWYSQAYARNQARAAAAAAAAAAAPGAVAAPAASAPPSPPPRRPPLRPRPRPQPRPLPDSAPRQLRRPQRRLRRLRLRLRPPWRPPPPPRPRSRPRPLPDSAPAAGTLLADTPWSRARPGSSPGVLVRRESGALDLPGCAGLRPGLPVARHSGLAARPHVWARLSVPGGRPCT